MVDARIPHQRLELDMNWEPCEPPRLFYAGRNDEAILDVGHMRLADDEQVTFVRASGAEYDVVAKEWGYYATPSLNARLPEFGLRSALVKSLATARRYILLVENGFEDSFNAYLQAENLVVETWLDTLDIKLSK
jgi:hypothetical protein